jgi:hypothetical protein
MGGAEMGLGDRLRGLFRASPERILSQSQIRARRGGYQSMLDREATVDDLDDLRAFATSRIGVELYVEPETAATDTTAVAVAHDGEWTRRRVGSPQVARALGAELRIPVYDAGIVGYPAAMRRYRK